MQSSTLNLLEGTNAVLNPYHIEFCGNDLQNTVLKRLSIEFCW